MHTIVDCVDALYGYIITTDFELGYHLESILANRCINGGMGEYVATCNLKSINVVDVRIPVLYDDKSLLKHGEEDKRL